MDKKLLTKLNQELEKEKQEIEKQLKKFASKDKELKHDWDTRFPNFNGKESGGSALEQAADEVEEYGNLLPVEHILEVKLKNINIALEKIKKGKYGICEKCKKPIQEEKLKAFPEATYCIQCKTRL